ncbi:hypothetical protein [Streptomyces sp. A012304]|uniref:hypothetical protein n=1 Tax=Streptomyces sp. A012304 TaxID=375446 RepID=UPI00222E83C3|nr:hypothetical protein [Streptomyces sp. A012304]GKQ36645.1 hypothetical protein ALMP_31850 [Streptomyces sp. A012304]
MELSDSARRLHHRLRGARIGPRVSIGRGTRIEADEIEIGAGARVGRDVRITADRVVVAADCHIGDGCRITAENLHLGYNCVLFPGVTVHTLGEARFGPHAKISRDAVLKAGRILTGTEFWMNRRAEIGGGGWRSGDGLFQAGDRCHIGRSSHVNTAEPVVLGDDTAIGMDCTLATHAHWQPADDGFLYAHGPVTLGSDVAIYSRSVISPGVRIADGGTVAAGSVVTKDVPERGLVGGVPARLLRIQERPASPAPLRTAALAAFARRRWPAAEVDTDDATCFRLRGTRPAVELLLEAGEVLHVRVAGPAGEHVCRFDFAKRVLSGEASEDSEALRGHLFSYGIRFRYEGYRRAPLRYEALVASGLED